MTCCVPTQSLNAVIHRLLSQACYLCLLVLVLMLCELQMFQSKTYCAIVHLQIRPLPSTQFHARCDTLHGAMCLCRM